MIKKLLVVCVFVFGVLVLAAMFAQKSDDLVINGQDFELEVAATQEERALGLSGRESLPQDHALLFVFSEPAQSGIWMKDMKFPIDIIWLDPSKKVIDLEEKVSPATYPEIFYPNERASYVVELNAGLVDSTGLEIGDILEF